MSDTMQTQTEADAELTTDVAAEYELALGDLIVDTTTHEVLELTGDFERDDLTSTEVLVFEQALREMPVDISQHSFRARFGRRYVRLADSAAATWGVRDLVDACVGEWSLDHVEENEVSFRHPDVGAIVVGERFRADTQTASWGVAFRAPEDGRKANITRTDSRRAALALGRAFMLAHDGSEPASHRYFRSDEREVSHYAAFERGAVVTYEAAADVRTGEVVVDMESMDGAAQIRRLGCESRVHDAVQLDEIRTVLTRM